MFDTFDILSGGVSFSHADGEANDWIRDNPQYQNGIADTYDNIARKIARGGLSEAEILDLWESVSPHRPSVLRISENVHLESDGSQGV